MIVGMDFGTTNSGMAVYDGDQVQVLGIDPSNSNSKVARTALYVTNDQQAYIGREAVDRYFDHNLGRPAKLERIWVGALTTIRAERDIFSFSCSGWMTHFFIFRVDMDRMDDSSLLLHGRGED